MSPLDPAQAEQLAAHRAAMRRARAQGRRWYLRGVLMAVIAAVAFYRGGQVNVLIGAAMTLLAALSVSLGHNMRRSAAEMAQKITMMEKPGPP
jgi:nitrogen fixation/metabolism regulation signal transduction histidine kinase